MPATSLLLVLALCALPPAAAAQSWPDAVKAGDYRKAADLLHPIVIDHNLTGIPTDPVPSRQLAELYARGLGVKRDPVVGCALAKRADAAAHVAGPKDGQDGSAYMAGIKESERFVFEHCGRLSDHEAEVAGRVFGCLTFGVPDETLTVGKQKVWVALAGFPLADAADERFLANLDCPQFVVRLRAVTIDPPADAAPGVTARQFVEALVWQGRRENGDSGLKYSLTWQMFEVRRQGIETFAPEQLYTVGKWPGTALPADFETAFTVEMIRSGHVRWRMDGVPPKRGWIMLPDKESR